MPKKEQKPPAFPVGVNRDAYIVLLCSIVFLTVFVAVQKYVFPPQIDERAMVTVLPHDFHQMNLEQQKKKEAITLRVPILIYHYVEYIQDPKDTIRASLNIQPYIFESQIKTLKDAGYDFLTMEEVAQALDDKKKIASTSVVITFDDGYRDFYTDVFPILKKYNAKVTAYIVPGFLDHPNFMYSKELEEISKSGLVEIGAHTMHHVWLRGMEQGRAQYEIKESKAILEAAFKRKVTAFAYPYGAFDDQAVSLVKDAGFLTAVSTVPGVQVKHANKLYMFRVRPGQRTGQTLLNWLQQETYAQW